MKKCFICGKEVKENEDVFTHFVESDSTMCKECKIKLEGKK